MLSHYINVCLAFTLELAQHLYYIIAHKGSGQPFSLGGQLLFIYLIFCREQDAKLLQYVFLYGICAGGKALFCIMLAQITVSRSKELFLPGKEENPENTQQFLVLFCVYLCMYVCAFSHKMFTDIFSFFGKALYAYRRKFGKKMKKTIKQREKNHLIPTRKMAIIHILVFLPFFVSMNFF